MIRRLLLPDGAEETALPLLIGRALRAFVDGYVAVLLPAYLLALGFEPWQVGILATATLLGSAVTTLAVGAWGHRFHHRRLLIIAALLMALTGFSFAAQSAFWPLLVIAFFGTLNPSSGDVACFCLWNTPAWRRRPKVRHAPRCSPATACWGVDPAPRR